MAVFELLQQAADSNFKKFIQIAGGDREKFDALEQRIADICGLFKHAPIKFQPGRFAIQKRGAAVRRLSTHIRLGNVQYGEVALCGIRPNRVYQAGYTKLCRPSWLQAPNFPVALKAVKYPRFGIFRVAPFEFNLSLSQHWG
jgi:hypothetical protein